jgi:hypothetical protein
MATYSEQLQQIANKYMRETGITTATAREIGAWAIRNRLWEPQPAALIRQCAEELSRAMREEYVTDPQGRRVRAKLPNPVGFRLVLGPKKTCGRSLRIRLCRE